MSIAKDYFCLWEKMMILPVIAVTFSLSGLLSAANLPEYPCYHAAAPPVMNGKDDDAGWQALPESGAFFIHGGADYAIEKRTFFRAVWTDDSLFIHIRCFEPLTEKMVASTTDGAALWDDDSIEMFFQPVAGSTYFHLAANSAGTRWNAIGPDHKETKPWKWEVKSGRWRKGWLVEVRIPFAVLGKTPKAGEKWAANIGRNTTTGPAVERSTCWPPVYKGFCDIERFGRFVFSGEVPNAKQVKIDEERLNGPFHQYLKEQCSAITKDAGQSEFMAALDKTTPTTETKPIKQVLAQLTALQSRADADPNDMVVMLTTWRKLMDLFPEKALKLVTPSIWVWGGPTKNWGGSMENDCLAKGADYFHARNVMYVYGPHSDEMLSILKPFNKVVCQIGTNWRTVAPQGDTVQEAERLSELSLRYPNITGAILDDFDTLNTGDEPFSPEKLKAIHSALRSKNPKLRLHVVTYTHVTHSPNNPYLPYIDVVTIWIWYKESHERMDADIAKARKDFPGKPIYMGVFLFDYDKGKAMPSDLLGRQLEKGRQYMADGVIQGMIILGDREIAKCPAQAAQARAFLEKHFAEKTEPLAKHPEAGDVK